jgi:hypothetical protein
MEIAEYQHSVRTAGMRGHGVYILRADGKCSQWYRNMNFEVLIAISAECRNE